MKTFHSSVFKYLMFSQKEKLNYMRILFYGFVQTLSEIKKYQENLELQEWISYSLISNLMEKVYPQKKFY